MLFYALLIELIGVIIALFRKTKFFDETPRVTDILQKQLEKYPVLSNIYFKVKENKDSDFLIHSLICPDTRPSSEPEINWMNIYYLWADARGSWIQASTLENIDPPEIHVKFYNEENTYASNIAFRLAGLRPLKREKEHNYLYFEAKIPPNIGEDCLKSISMSFRFIDQWVTHWSRMKGDDVYANEFILKTNAAPNHWQSFYIPLYDDNWRVFKADGNFKYCKDQPQFHEMILVVIIEFGSNRRDERPGHGKGEVHLRNFCLKNKRE